jgi:uncharacterized protein YbjT (DUF2867 family)
MPEIILVIGATGMLGEPVARRLAADGHDVRVMSRNRSKVQAIFNSTKNITCLEADVSDLSSLQTAMENCTGIHLNLSGGELESYGTQQVVKAALTLSTTTIQRISLISGVTTCPENCWYEGTKSKLQAESYLMQSGFQYTIFRCTMFLETLPKWKILVGDQPTKWHWLAAKDYARMVSKSYVTPNATNKILFLYGPGSPHTLKEAVDKFFIPLCAPDRPPIPTISIEQLKSTSNPDYTSLSGKVIAKFQWLGKIQELGSPVEANELLGEPTISLEQWCKEYSL